MEQPAKWSNSRKNCQKQFEISLDKHWEHQEVKYDYTANISTQSKPGSYGKTKINMEEIEADIVAEQSSVHWRSYGILCLSASNREGRELGGASQVK